MIDYEIVEHCGTLSPESHIMKEVNLVKWNKGKTMLDIRKWPKGHEYCGKGISLNRDEALELLDILKDYEDTILCMNVGDR